MARPVVKVVHASDAKAIKRKLRTPQHSFNIKSRPYEITPFMIAPVLPGETMSNLLMQSRVVTDPILNPLVGWWKEYYFYYIPLKALENPKYDGYISSNTTNAKIADMFIGETNAFYDDWNAGASVPFYNFNGGIPWVEWCTQLIAAFDFSDEGDIGWATPMDNYPAAYFDRRNGFQSLSTTAPSGSQDDPELPGVDTLEDEEHDHAAFPLQASGALAQWEILRDAGLTDVTFEDYQRAQGVDVPRADDVDPSSGEKLFDPELIRFVRKWTYPNNVVQPDDTAGQVVGSACSWSIVERADKARLFKQPGFIFGVTVTRPKVYWGNVKGSLTGYMSNYLMWPSVVLRDHPESTLFRIADDAAIGALINQGGDVFLDAKDTFLYGEQFFNYAPTVADTHALSVPGDVVTGGGIAEKRPTLAMAKSFFVDAAGTKNFVREDGVVHLSIKSRLGTDTTPGGFLA